MAELKLPLIGDIGPIECLEKIGSVIEIPGSSLEKLKRIEKALGDYLVDSGKCNAILDLLFPKKNDINVEAITSGKVGTAPLFAKVFGRDEKASAKGENASDSKRNNRTPSTPGIVDHIPSTWSNLMLELGEFKLDEQFDKIEGDIENLIKYFCVMQEKPEDYFVLWSLIELSEKLKKDIWNRITGDDISLVFIDDDSNFDKICGLDWKDEKKSKKPDNDEIKHIKDKMCWINPVEEHSGKKKGLDIKSIKNEVQKLFQASCPQNKKVVLPVLVIDLLYKDESGVNKIKGDNLIRELRKEFAGEREDEMAPLIVGFTGGKSPFVINSAVKAGADIVIMKERGQPVNAPNPHGSGNPSGLFDLLWALSQNISKWRFLESYKEALKSGKMHYKPVLDRLFFSIDDESPFWRKYLKNWLRDVENIRLKNIFEEKATHE